MKFGLIRPQEFILIMHERANVTFFMEGKQYV